MALHNWWLIDPRKLESLLSTCVVYSSTQKLLPNSDFVDEDNSCDCVVVETIPNIEDPSFLLIEIFSSAAASGHLQVWLIDQVLGNGKEDGVLSMHHMAHIHQLVPQS